MLVPYLSSYFSVGLNKMHKYDMQNFLKNHFYYALDIETVDSKITSKYPKTKVHGNHSNPHRTTILYIRVIHKKNVSPDTTRPS